MVLWITGISGSGKTTLGRLIHRKWKAVSPDTVFVDGDDMRRIFDADQAETDYSVEGRKKNAERICEICAWLDRQNLNVVCSIQCIFESAREWNRKTFSSYYEVYIDVPKEILKKRDVRGLFRKADLGLLKNVVGHDIEFFPPLSPDYVYSHAFDDRDLECVADGILGHALYGK